MAFPRVSVVIPALNEARNLPHVFANMPPDIHEVILVDGYSVDGTVDVARAQWPGIRITAQTRTGKGNALACGFALASGDIIAAVDADGSADPSEIPRFVQALVDGADFAKGTRFAAGGGSTDLTRLRRTGNHVLTSLFNATYGSRYSDLCYGFNVFWRRHAEVLRLDSTSPGPSAGSRLWGDGFEIETLIHVRAAPPPGRPRGSRLGGDGFEIETLIHVRVAQAGLVVAEVPSFEHPRVHGASNLNAVSDGIRVLRTIMTERRATRPRPVL